MILAGRLAGEEELQRFRSEAGVAARLRHPNIVAVHEVGEVEGQLFFSMEFIEGRTLAQRLTEGPVPGRSAAGARVFRGPAPTPCPDITRPPVSLPPPSSPP